MKTIGITILFLFCLLLSSPFVTSTIGEDLQVGNLVYYKFEGNADDSIGSTDGTINGATPTSDGIIGDAYDYDGTNDKINLGSSDLIDYFLSSAQFTKPFSISAWAYINNDDNNNYIMSITDSGTQWQFIISFGSSSNVKCGSHDGMLTTISTFLTSEWHHIVCVWDGTTGSIFVNGVDSTTTGNIVSDDNSENNNLYIGHGQAWGSYFDGVIDELSIWNRTLNADEVDYLYNNGEPTSSQQYPYPEPPSPYFQITAYNPLYESYYQVFNATLYDSVTLDPQITHWNTTTGTITTNYESNYTKGTFGIDVFTTTGDLYPFNITGGYDINTSGNLEVNLTNQSATTGNDYDYTITIKIINVDNGNVIDNFTSTFLKNPFSLTQTRINASGIVKYGVTGGIWELFINASGYAYHRQNYTINNNTNLSISLYTKNSVSISIYNESSGNKITENITIKFTTDTTEKEYNTITGELYIDELTPSEFIVTFNGANWSLQTYTITVGQSSHQFLNAYLDNGYSQTIFTVKDQLSGVVIEDSLVSIYRFINGSWAVTASKLTDVVGKVTLNYKTDITYKFTIIKTGFISKDFTLSNIEESYEIPLTPESTIIPSTDYTGVGILYYPKIFSNDVMNNFTFVISSPTGFLTSYSLNVSYPNNNNFYSGTNVLGGTFLTTINITNAGLFEQVFIDYTYTTSDGETHTFSIGYEIISGTIGEHTFMKIAEDDYGLGDFEKVFIATMTVLISAGMAFLLAGMAGSLIIGSMIYGFFIYISFIPLWSVIIMFLAGFAMLYKGGGQ